MIITIVATVFVSLAAFMVICGVLIWFAVLFDDWTEYEWPEVAEMEERVEEIEKIAKQLSVQLQSVFRVERTPDEIADALLRMGNGETRYAIDLGHAYLAGQVSGSHLIANLSPLMNEV